MKGKVSKYSFWITLLGAIAMLSILTPARHLGWPDFDVQLHDTYIHFDAGTAVFLIMLAVIAIVSLFLIVKFGAERYRIIALLIAIVNPLVAILVVVAINVLLAAREALTSVNPSMEFKGYMNVVIILLCLLALQAAVEVIALKKFFALLRNNNGRNVSS
jgi:hypothetical protein